MTKNMRETFNGNIRYRAFKVSINLPFFHIYQESKVYKIKSPYNFIMPVFSYSLVCILFGFFGLKIFKTLEALHINFSGGVDYSKQIIEYEFDYSTNIVWNNLTRVTSQKLDRHAIHFLMELQEVYMESNNDVFSANNIYTLKNEMNRKGYKNINEEDILDFFEALKILSTSQT